MNKLEEIISIPCKILLKFIDFIESIGIQPGTFFSILLFFLLLSLVLLVMKSD